MKISGWGRFPEAETNLIKPNTQEELIQNLQSGDLIPRGNGRSYGDSAINSQKTVDMRAFSHFLSFDNSTGILVAEAGVMLSDIIETFLPRGWFPYVTPGTKFVTLGGAIAADVHGKNHHKEGSFGAYVHWMEILTHHGEIVRCSRIEEEDLFQWTIGGMGLTGIILRVSVQLRRVETSWIKQKTIPANNLSEVFDLFEENRDYTYSVAWIDCLSHGASLGRSVLMLGEHALMGDLSEKKKKDPLYFSTGKQITVPFDFPSGVLNRFSVALFNQFYFQINKMKGGTSLIDWNSFFYPLDAILKWNRIYGKKGFTQFQCALPADASREGIEALLKAISESKMASFLAVLKEFGQQESHFSFPMAGYTLALDFPINKKTELLMEKLHEITLEYGGRFYLAKDAHLTPDTLRKSDHRVEIFTKYRTAAKAKTIFHSLQSTRLHL